MRLFRKTLLAVLLLGINLAAGASAVFDGVNDQLRGTLNTQRGDPITIAAKILKADHLLAFETIVAIGASNSSNNDSYICRLSTGDNTLATTSTDSAGNGTASTKDGFLDNTWFSVICTINNDDGTQAGNARTTRVESSQSSNDTTRTVAGTLDDIAIGEALNDQADFTGKIAEVAIWVGDLASGDEVSYANNSCTANIDSSNLIGYWSLVDDSSDFTNEGLDTGGDLTASGNAAIDSAHPSMGACGSAATFTSAPASGTITSTTIPVSFTSDQTATVKGTVCANGSAGNAAETLLGQCSGGGAAVATISEAVVATVGDGATFTGLTANTTYDLSFIIDAAIDSSLASLADEATLALPTITAGPTAGDITSATIEVTFTLSATGTMYGVACPDGQTASVAQILTQDCSGGDAVSSISEPVVATVSDGATFSGLAASTTYDLFFAGRRDPDNTAAASPLANQTTDAAAANCSGYPTGGKQCLIITSVHATSPFFGQGVAASDVVVIDEVTSPSSYPVTIELDATVSYEAAGDPSRQIIEAEVTGVGGFTLVFNNRAPQVIPQGEGSDVFFEDELIEQNSSPEYDLASQAEDPEGDEITWSWTVEPTGMTLGASTGQVAGTPTVCGEFLTEVTLTDEWGSTTVVPGNIFIGSVVPSVIGEDEATGIALIEAECSLDAVAGEVIHSSTIPLGDIATMDPPAGTLVEPDAVITYRLSSGSLVGRGVGIRTRLGLGIH